MTIQLNRAKTNALPVRNTCERRYDLTQSILQNVSHCDDPFRPIYATQPPFYRPSLNASAAFETPESYHFQSQSNATMLSVVADEAAIDCLTAQNSDLDEVSEAERAEPGVRSQTDDARRSERSDAPQRLSGIWRSKRGAIELIVHPTGTSIKPHYNYSGCLLSVELDDGSKFVRAHSLAPWMVLNEEGKPVRELQISSLTIDGRGNLIYITKDNVKTVIACDGTVQAAAIA